MSEPSSKPAFPRKHAAGCPFDPAEDYQGFRENDPVARVSCPAGVDAWLVTRYDDVRTVLGSSALSSSVPPIAHADPQAVFDDPVLPGSILQLDGAEHVRLRRLLTAEFSVKRIQALRPHIQQVIDSHVDAMLESGGPVDLVRALALPIPSLVICELLGVPYAQRDRFEKQSAIMSSVDVDPVIAKQADVEIMGYVRDLVHEKMRDPGDDLTSRLIRRSEESPRPLTVDELVMLVLSLLVAGHETTTNMIALGTTVLLRHPDQVEALRTEPGLLPSAVEELLRYLTIVHFGLFRSVTQDIPLGAETLRAGDWLIAALASGNRDASVFSDADRLDVRRRPAAHLGFGYGAHQCLGQQLARVELQQVFGTLFTRVPTLRLAVPVEELDFKDDSVVYGLHSLPVTW
ncbi:cytochrome P450 [Pseudonocardia lacus]|uniref:cytochrome P450 n=1 Tax=Pseudonocardia lacus TaxID=2835865 RepID=UPI001BDDBE6D|nr:cytochrome P450 [Pseudonocardia lacus]